MSGLANISLEDLLGGDIESLSLDELERILNNAVRDSVNASSKDPNSLVRVVNNGHVTWMTTDQAREMVGESEQNQDEDLKNALEFALRGDSRILGMELQVFMTLAWTTLKRYRDKGLIPQSEIQRSEPNLSRVARTLNYTLGELKRIEDSIDEFRSKHPVINEFETRMAQLLTHQKQGEADRAHEIARELAAIKSKYVRLSRGLQSDMNDSYHQRLELQRQKKSVLSWHKYLAAQREGVLQEENAQLRQSMDTVRTLLQRAVAEQAESYLSQLNQKQQELESNENELEAVQAEISYLEVKEKQSTSLIEQLEDKLGVQRKAEKPEEKPPAPEEKPAEQEAESEKQKRQRMAIMSQRRV